MGGNRVRQVVLALVLPFLSTTLSGPAGADEICAENARCECAGRYRFVGGDSERASVARAVDGVVSDMNVFVRAIARGRLERATRVAEKVEVSRDGSKVTVKLDGRAYVTARDGEPVQVTTPTGEEVTLTHRHVGPDVEQRFAGADGGRVNVFRCEGERLRLDVRIHSPRLPHDLRYSLTYARD